MKTKTEKKTDYQIISKHSNNQLSGQTKKKGLGTLANKTLLEAYFLKIITQKKREAIYAPRF